MKNTSITLPSQYIHQVFQLVTDAGVESQNWLANASNLSREISSDFVTLPWHAFKALMLEAIQLTKHQHFGLLLGERLNINMHGALGYAAINAATSRQVIELTEQFLALRTDLLSLKVSESNQLMYLTFSENRQLEQLHSVLFEAVILALRNSLDFLTLGSLPIEAVNFSFGGNRQIAEDLFGCTVNYNQSWSGMVISQQAADKPLSLANSLSFAQARQVCQEELAKLNAQQSLSYNVRKLLLKSQRGFPSLEATARRFYLTPRTFHRHLLNEGTSYRAILEDVRRLLATRYLKDGHMSVKEIAYALGYYDTASFRKAFKRWYQCAPMQFKTLNQS